MSGGIAVLYQVADRLAECGFPVTLTGMPGTSPGLDAAGQKLPVVAWGKAGENLAFSSDDLVLVPEGWPNMAAPALAASARVRVYVQNWAYLFSALPEGVCWQQLPARFLTVSHPVAWFVHTIANLPVDGIIPPALDASLFHAEPASRPRDRIRIAWMPRKNKALAEQIRHIATAALVGRGSLPRMEWVPIHGMAPDDVAQTMRSCHIFLATGFPEGFALPPLEAMACGCLVTGFAGFGGWEYMRQARPGLYTPRLELRQTVWGGNGLFAADGDVVEAARALVDAIDITLADGRERALILEAAALAAATYSTDAQREAVRAVWTAYTA